MAHEDERSAQERWGLLSGRLMESRDAAQAVVDAVEGITGFTQEGDQLTFTFDPPIRIGGRLWAAYTIPGVHDQIRSDSGEQIIAHLRRVMREAAE